MNGDNSKQDDNTFLVSSPQLPLAMQHLSLQCEKFSSVMRAA